MTAGRQPLTSEQRSAVEARGNVLLMAGAGTGKTHTLVARCLAEVLRLEQPVSLTELLMVTFTEAAAAEMRQRLRGELERECLLPPNRPWVAEQLALVETARISTLHGFCLRLVKDHFYELGLDPDLTVLAEDQAQLLRDEALEELLRARLADESGEVERLLLDLGGEQNARSLVLRLHSYARTLPDPDAWWRSQEALFAEDAPRQWREWLVAGAADWRTDWLPELERQPSGNERAAACAALLRRLPPQPQRSELAEAVSAAVALDAQWPRGTKIRFRRPIERFFEEAEFLHSVARAGPGGDPLIEDWRWSEGPMRTLVSLAREFGERFASAKRELATLDFQDLEQFALQLLRGPDRRGLTPLAGRLRCEFRAILVDEYQDINRAQDAILRALGREGVESNRFLVGDTKQSIYRFRLADPHVFQGYVREWGGGSAGDSVLPLTGNFRSRPAILRFVNRLFAQVMRASVGGIDYTDEHRLQPAAHGDTAAGGETADVEIHLLLKAGAGVDDDDLGAADHEAAFVAARLRRLVAENFRVVDRSTGELRPVDWGDMAVLLRAPRTRAEAYAQAFAAAGIPIQLSEGGFYERSEVSDLLSLLQVLDNPRQDLPLLAVLRSPWVGLTPDELGAVRLVRRSGPWWSAVRWVTRHRVPGAEPGSSDGAGRQPAPEVLHRAQDKLRTFLESHGRWRALARIASLSECLQTALEESGYQSWLAAQSNPEPGLANVRLLLELTRKFDQFQRQGLHRFLRFVSAQRDLDVDPTPAASAPVNAVRLLSVHQSKGLEFPVVVAADLGKRFNLTDLNSPVVVDEEYGLCPLVLPPDGGRRYPSLPNWLARRRQRREQLGEELRLFYVACTRARDRLILCGTTTPTKAREHWPQQALPLTDQQLVSASSWLDWLGPCLANHALTGSSPDDSPSYTLYEPEERPWAPEHPAAAPSQDLWPADAPPPELTAENLAELRSRLASPYAFAAATCEPAKVSVSQLRRRVRDEADAEARQLFLPRGGGAAGTTSGEVDAAARGTAHHAVLERIPLEMPVTEGAVLAVVREMQGSRVLTPEEADALDLPSLLAFWRSDLGTRIQRSHPHVHRELPFTVRCSAEDLAALHVPVTPGLPPGDFVVVQGIIDLAVLAPEAILLVDFKTDRIPDTELDARVAEYRPQLGLYALALERIYRRPVGECWLHFLDPRRSVRLETFGTDPSTALHPASNKRLR